MRTTMAALAVAAMLATGCGRQEEVKPESWTAFEQNQLWGFKDAAGQVRIPAQYHVVQVFNARGLAAVADEQGWLYINAQNQPVIRPFIFDNGPDYFQDGLARFTQNGRFGFFDEEGKIIIPAQFDFAYPFEDGKAKVGMGCRRVQDGEHERVEGGEWKFIDRQGRAVQ